MKVPFKRAVQWWRLAHSQRYRPHPARSPRPTRGPPAPPPPPPRLWTVFTPLFPYLRTGGGGWASSFLLPERWRASSLLLTASLRVAAWPGCGDAGEVARGPLRPTARCSWAFHTAGSPDAPRPQAAPRLGTGLLCRFPPVLGCLLILSSL